MIETHTVSGIQVSPEKIGKNGKPYKMLALTTADGRRMSTFINFPDQAELQMQDGKEYPLVVEQNGQYWNFKLAKKSDLVAEDIEDLKKSRDGMRDWAAKVEERLAKLESAVG